MGLPNKHCVCTIVTSNYLSFSEVLYKSFSKFNNDTFVLLICDDYRSSSTYYLDKFDWLKSITLLFLDDLSVKNIDYLIKAYTAFEFSNSLKPSLIKHLLNTHDKIVYFDSDIFINDKIDFIFSELNNHPICFTRHFKRPLPLDSHKPTDLDYNLYGWINGGFWAIKKSAVSMIVLDFLEERIHKFGLFDIGNGMFTDQKFLDSAFILFYPNIHIIDDCRLNLGYWNFHEGTIENKDNVFYFNFKRIIFVHMSCFNFKTKSFNKSLTRCITNPQQEAISALSNYYIGYFSSTPTTTEMYKFININDDKRDIIDRKYFYKNLHYPNSFIKSLIQLLLFINRQVTKLLRSFLFFK